MSNRNSFEETQLAYNDPKTRKGKAKFQDDTTTTDIDAAPMNDNIISAAAEDVNQRKNRTPQQSMRANKRNSFEEMQLAYDNPKARKGKAKSQDNTNTADVDSAPMNYNDISAAAQSKTTTGAMDDGMEDVV